MTCIVGIIDKDTGKVFIGGDSASSNDSSITIIKDPKVFKNGDFLFGCTTSFRMMQLLKYSLKLPPVKEDIIEYMCTDFIDAVRKCFKDGGYMQKYTGGDERGGTFLVGYEDKLFKIEEDFQVSQSANGIDACGCGEYFALGALYAMENNSIIQSSEKVLKALHVAEELSTWVCGPFKILHT